MSDDAIWKRLDEHGMKIDNLTVEQATTKAEVRALERRLDKNVANIMETLTRMEAKQDSQWAYQNQQKGATKFGAWVAGVALTIITVTVSIWSMVFGQ